jgi:hypothetical protein
MNTQLRSEVTTVRGQLETTQTMLTSTRSDLESARKDLEVLRSTLEARELTIGALRDELSRVRSTPAREPRAIVGVTRAVTTVTQDGARSIVGFNIRLRNSGDATTTAVFTPILTWNGKPVTTQPKPEKFGLAPNDTLELHPSATLDAVALSNLEKGTVRLRLELTVRYNDRGAETVYSYVGEAPPKPGAVTLIRHEWSR